MRKPLRIVIDVARGAGMRVVEIKHGGKHTSLKMNNGVILRLSKGCRVGPNFEHVIRDSIRKIARAKG